MFKAVEDLQLKHKSASLVVTGHSLGAAFATFAAAALKTSMDFDKILFYTFGSPRMGNKAFADYIFGIFPIGQYSRVTHYNDLVVHSPLNMMDFQHTGYEVWYENAGTDMTHKTCENFAGQDENQDCTNQFYSRSVEAHLTYLGMQTGSGACKVHTVVSAPLNETEVVIEEAQTAFLSQ